MQGLGKDKVFKGTVTKLYHNRLQLKAPTAQLFDVAFSDSTVVEKRSGTKAEFLDLAVGDKLEVIGELFWDGSVLASRVRDMSLYFKISAFSGKLESFLPEAQGFVLLSRANGQQEVRVTPETNIVVNGSAARLQDLKLGARVKLRASWERSREKLRAVSVDCKLRMVKIDFIGQLVVRTAEALTVTSGGSVYGVDVRSAQILNRHNQSVGVNALDMSSQVRVWGKHLSESTEVTAQKVKQVS